VHTNSHFQQSLECNLWQKIELTMYTMNLLSTPELYKTFFKKITEDLRKSVEQFQETRKEILFAMSLTVLEALFLNLFSSSFVDYLKTNSSTSFYGLSFFVSFP